MSQEIIAKSVMIMKDDNLGYKYIHKNKPLLEKRLLQEGIRLAGKLNRIFK